jgi:hypothetical protein
MPSRNPNFSEPYKLFVASMNITVNEWRDGIGFNIDALKKVTDSDNYGIMGPHPEDASTAAKIITVP